MGGYKKWATSDVLTAADLNGYCSFQSVMVFATTAARDSAIAFSADILAEELAWHYESNEKERGTRPDTFSAYLPLARRFVPSRTKSTFEYQQETSNRTEAVFDRLVPKELLASRPCE